MKNIESFPKENGREEFEKKGEKEMTEEEIQELIKEAVIEVEHSAAGEFLPEVKKRLQEHEKEVEDYLIEKVATSEGEELSDWEMKLRRWRHATS